VAALLVESRNYLGGLLELPRLPAVAIDGLPGRGRLTAVTEKNQQLAETLL
jgi:hypothetical protein